MLTVYTLDQSEKWDSLVRTFQTYDTYWLSGYVKAFRLHGDGEPLLFYYEKDTSRAIKVVMKRDIAALPRFVGKLPLETFYDLVTPYGYGGWLVEGGATGLLFQNFEAWCEINHIVSEFVRFHPVLQNHISAKDGYEVISLGETVAMDLSSPETIWGNITSQNRNMIRKAIKNGIRIYNGRSAKLYEKFRCIYNGTMDKDHADQYYYFSSEFYQSILEDLPQNAQIFYAELNGQMIAASIMLAANGKMNYHLSGSLGVLRNLAPTNLLLYQAALWGCANGCKTLFLGGGVGSGEDGLFQFKRSFYRGDLYRFHIGRKIYSRELYDKLVSLCTDLPEDSSFFPAYRA